MSAMELLNTTLHQTNVPYNHLTGNESARNVTGTLPPLPNTLTITCTVLYGVIFFVGILGNFVVIYVIKWTKRMQSTVNMYLVNLCVADLLVMVVCMPTALVDIFTRQTWWFGDFMCE